MEDALNRFEDKREIKNLMGKYVQSLTIRRDAYLWNDFWSKRREDVSLGLNEGWYVGPAAIQGYYNARKDYYTRSSRLMQKLFPDKLGDKCDEELYGVGVFEQKPLQSGLICVAGDRKTAKGLWICNGNFADIGPAGPSASWIWGYFAADFVYEGEQWMLWHLLYLEDIHSRCGQNWAAPQAALPERPEFTGLRDRGIPAPTVKRVLRMHYSPDRPFTHTPLVPMPYETFAETFSYGPEQEQL